jgi:hypothetical protein
MNTSRNISICNGSAKPLPKVYISSDNKLWAIPADLYDQIRREATANADKEWMDNFDAYACIKNDAWYIEWKKLRGAK